MTHYYSEQDDDHIYGSRCQRALVCILATSVPLERQHLQIDVQGNADIRRTVHNAEYRLQAGTGRNAATVMSLYCQPIIIILIIIIFCLSVLNPTGAKN